MTKNVWLWTYLARHSCNSGENLRKLESVCIHARNVRISSGVRSIGRFWHIARHFCGKRRARPALKNSWLNFGIRLCMVKAASVPSGPLRLIALPILLFADINWMTFFTVFLRLFSGSLPKLSRILLFSSSGSSTSAESECKFSSCQWKRYLPLRPSYAYDLSML